MLSCVPAGVAVPSTCARESPSSTVILVVDPSKVPPSGSASVTEETSSPSSTVPSQVRRVARPPMTPEPPFSLGRAVALFVVSANALAGASSTSNSAIATPSACRPNALPLLS